MRTFQCLCLYRRGDWRMCTLVPNSLLQMAQKREIYWFALTVFKNLPGLVDAFSRKGWETFRAFAIEETVEGSRIIRKEVPLVKSLLFVNCPMKELVNFKYQNNDWFMYYKAPTGTDPGPVDDDEMKAFMLVTSVRDGNLRVLGEDRPEYHKGDKVRVISGPYKGAEGYVKRIRRSRELLVCVEGVTVVVVSQIPPEYLEKI